MITHAANVEPAASSGTTAFTPPRSRGESGLEGLRVLVAAQASQ